MVYYDFGMDMKRGSHLEKQMRPGRTILDHVNLCSGVTNNSTPITFGEGILVDKSCFKSNTFCQLVGVGISVQSIGINNSILHRRRALRNVLCSNFIDVWSNSLWGSALDFVNSSMTISKVEKEHQRIEAIL